MSKYTTDGKPSTTAPTLTQPVAYHTGFRREAEWLVKTYHYSRLVPSNVQLSATAHVPGGLFGDSGVAIAACFFCIPAARWSEQVYELTRLVRHPEYRIALTGLIAFASDVLRRRGVDLLVSYADATHGHHGGIYQAASWHYNGCKSRMDGLVVDGEYLSGRTCNHRFGTRSPSKVAELHPLATVEPHFDLGKHLYWRALNKRGKSKAFRLGLQSLDYPKPGADNTSGLDAIESGGA